MCRPVPRPGGIHAAFPRDAEGVRSSSCNVTDTEFLKGPHLRWHTATAEGNLFGRTQHQSCFMHRLFRIFMFGTQLPWPVSFVLVTDGTPKMRLVCNLKTVTFDTVPGFTTAIVSPFRLSVLAQSPSLLTYSYRRQPHTHHFSPQTSACPP